MSESKTYTEHDAVRTALSAGGAYSREKPRLIPTGLRALDSRIGGLRPAELLVLGARPGCGKTETLLHVLRSSTLVGFRGGFISLEDDLEVLGGRLQQEYTRMAPEDLRMAGHEMPVDAVDYAAKASKASGLRLLHLKNPTLHACCAAIKRMKADGCVVVGVDYFNRLMPTTGVDTPRFYGDAVMVLESVAAEQGVALVIAAQGKTPQWDSKERRYRYEMDESDLANTSYLARVAHFVVVQWRSGGKGIETVQGKICKMKIGFRGPVRFNLVRDAVTGAIVTKEY